MARRGKVSVSITADNSGLKKGLRDSEGDLGHLQRATRRATGGMSLAFKAAGGVIAGAAVADQIRETVKAAEESQVSNRKMAAQLKALGISYRAHAKEIDAVIQKTSQLAGLDDEDLQDAFSNIVRSTGSVSQGLKLTGLAADLARAKHMDVAKAGETVAKVFNGNVGVLKRMGIAITPVTAAQDKLKESTKHATAEQTRAAKESDKTATAQKALGVLQQRLGGQAAAYGKTAAGAQDRFRVAVENLREKLGEKLLPVIAKVADKASVFVDQMTNGTGAGGRFANKLKEIADRIRPIAKFFADHPRLIAVAVGAWAAYRLAAAAAIAATRLKALGLFKGLARPAAVAGAQSGTAFGAASNTAATAAMRKGKWSRVGAGIGGALGIAAGIAMVGELSVQVNQWIKNQPWYKPPGGKGGFLDSLIPTSVLPKIPKHPGGLLGALGVGKPKPPNRSGQNLRPATTLGTLAPTHAPHLTKRPPRAHGAVAHTASVATGPTAHAANAGDTGIVALGRQLQREGYTVGEHPAFGGVAPVHVQGSYHYSGEAIDVNGGPGGEPGSLDALYARLQGRPGVVELLWRVKGHFDHLHVAVVGGTNPLSGSRTTSAAAAAGGARPQRRGPLIASMGGTLKSVAPHRMGHTATGDKGFQQTGEGAEPTQAQQDIKRQFQIGVRLQAINSELRTARGGRRAQLLDERARLTTELAGIGRAGGTADIPGADAYLGSLDKDAALAELTPDKADDIDVAKRNVTARQGILDYEQSHGFSDSDIAEAARALKSAQDSLDSLTSAVSENTQQLLDLAQQARDEAERATAVSQSQYGVLAKAIADVANGQIGGRLGLGFQSPSYAGGVARP